MSRPDCMTWREEFPHLASLARFLTTLVIVMALSFAGGLISAWAGNDIFSHFAIFWSGIIFACRHSRPSDNVRAA